MPVYLVAAIVFWGLQDLCSPALGQQRGTKTASDLKTLSTSRDPERFILGPRTPVNPPNVGNHGEVMAAADPESANNIIVCGYRANQKLGSAYEGYVYQSGDGGATWREVLVDSTSQWVSEESCAFGPDHQAYFASGVSDTSRGEPHHEFGNLYLYRSSDGGKTWQTVQISRFMDYTSMVVDSTRSPWRNTLYIFANNLADGTGGWLGGGPSDPPKDKRPFLAVRRELPEPIFFVTDGSFNTDDEGVKSRGKYPQGSAVLSDGTVLSIFSGDKEERTDGTEKKTRVFYVAAGISEDGGKTLRKKILYQNTLPSVLAGITVDQSRDRIYVCWTPRYQENLESDLMLAVSSDKGHTWNVKSPKRPEGVTLDVRAGSASLASNKDGVLGFMWYGKNGDRAYFGASFDGGSSIAEVISLTPKLPADRPRDAAVADDRRLFVYPPSWDNSSHHLEPLTILTFGPGLSGVPVGNALVADKNGIFHPVWSEVSNGPASLWTRTVSLDTAVKSTASVEGLTDISDRIVSHISNVRYDHLENLIAFDLAVTNKATEAIGDPLLVVVMSLNPQAGLSADNADNGKLGDGAAWMLRIPPGGLSLEHSSEPRTLIFRVNMEREDILRNNGSLDIGVSFYGKVR